MKLEIFPKDMKLDTRQESLIVEKLGEGLNKYLESFSQDVAKATVKVEKGSRWGFRVNFSMWLPKKHHIFVEEKDKKFANAVVAVKKHVERQIREYKEKLKEN